MRIKIDELQSITIHLLSKLKESIGNEMELNSDYFWEISNDELYDPYKEPKDFSLGQLSHNLEELKRLSKSDDAISYDLKRLSDILKAVSIEHPTAF